MKAVSAIKGIVTNPNANTYCAVQETCDPVALQEDDAPAYIR